MSSNSKKLNVVQIIADQHHSGWMGCAGHPQVKTPHLDGLSENGVRMTSAYAQNPICTPSRMSILSGQYCQNFGYYGLSGPVPHRLPTYLGHFREHGYRTAAFGKLHLPHGPEGNWLLGRVDRLADSYESSGGLHGESEFLLGLEADGLRDLEDSWHNPKHYGAASIALDAMVSALPYERTQERWCVREALRFIDESTEAGHPFCMQVAFQKPHHPLLPQQQFWDLYDEDLALPATIDEDPGHRPPHFRETWQATRERAWEYAEPGEDWRTGARRAWRGTLACVSQVDDVIGHLLRGLESRGLRESTILVYHSDHGAYHGIHGIEEKAPGICSDAVCRVPMIWSGPGIGAVGQRCDALVENLDIGPTLASLCGLPPMDWTDGCDLTPLLKGTAESVKEVAVTENVWSKAMRWGPWRFVNYPPSMFDGEDVGELYDLEADPDETRNLYHDPNYREQVERCRRRLLQWMVESRRAVTVHPHLTPPARPGFPPDPNSSLSEADGRLRNGQGPAERIRRGQLNYI